MNRQERIKNVYEFIKLRCGSEYAFGILYEKLLEEIALETAYNSDRRTNLYLNNLIQTRDKQASSYQSAKDRRSKKGAPQEFKDFVSNFEQDVREAMHL